MTSVTEDMAFFYAFFLLFLCLLVAQSEKDC